MTPESTPQVRLRTVSSHFLRVGEVAAQAEVSIDTVRYYEQRGLLHGIPLSGDGQRRFPQEAVDRIRVIRQAAAIGFSLDELAAIFRRRASGNAPCGHVLDVAKSKLADLDERISELQSLRDTLEDVITNWSARVSETPAGGLAHLLESLNRKGEKP